MTNPVAYPRRGIDAIPRPTRLEMISMIAVAAALVIYLPILLHRTAHNLGDVQVFFRAAWAVWTGYPLYQVVDNHGWSYHYPPTFAILMGPFADPLPGYPALPWALPFAASVGVFYALSVAAMLLAAHVWAKALEDHSGIAPAGGQSGWWGLRIAPILLLAPYFGASFARGQPTTILILLACIFLKSYADRRVIVASAALALAIAIKIFPAALLIIPLLRRDIATLAGRQPGARFSCSPCRPLSSVSIRRSSSTGRCGSSGSRASPTAPWRAASKSRYRRGRTTWWRSARCSGAPLPNLQPTCPTACRNGRRPCSWHSTW